MHGLSGKDPAVTMPMENVLDFVTGHLASDHKVISQQIWPQLVKLLPSGRWAKVFGPMSSAIATLLGFGWTLPDISTWQSPDGVLWGIDFHAKSLVTMLREVLQLFV